MFSYFLLPNKSSADIDTYIQPLFDLPSIMTSKNGQNIKSLKVSHVRYQIIGFWELQIPFWYPFWPQMILEAFNLQILMTSWGQNMKSMKMCHMRFQIIGFFCVLILFWYPFWNWDSSNGRWPPNIDDLRKSKDKINENGSFYISNHCFSESNI